jgi:hypothetical protein
MMNLNAYMEYESEGCRHPLGIGMGVRHGLTISAYIIMNMV